jgi:NAD(P)-dependent dehydrogenase (short-subunit alcohol dehydrogenase family)
MNTKPVVLVTGAAQRIGREIALDLAAHGWAVAVHYRSSAAAAAQTVAALHDLGAPAAAFAADLADEDECEALVPAVVRSLGRIDAVVNNASLFEYDDLASFSAAHMHRAWRANTAPAILLARALQAALLAAPDDGRQGAVVNLLDQKLWNPNPDYFSYTLSKAALAGHGDAGTGAGAACAGVRRGAGRDAAVGRDEPIRIRRRAPHDAAAAQFHPAGRGTCRALLA